MLRAKTSTRAHAAKEIINDKNVSRVDCPKNENRGAQKMRCIPEETSASSHHVDHIAQALSRHSSRKTLVLQERIHILIWSD